jgi:signal transduction histidine kinase
LADVWEHIVAIERLLAEHDVWDRVGELIEPLHLDDLVRDASGRLHPAVRGNLTIEPDLSLSRLPPVSGYRPTLVKAITEILNNAAEAIQRAGQERGHVWVSAAVEPGDKGDMVHVKFLDDGYGIEAAHLGRIFEQDFSTKPEGRSHRGLHWCSNAVGAMKGRMYAESAGKGRGACIHLLLRTAGSPSDG